MGLKKGTPIKLTADQVRHLHRNSGYYGGFKEGGVPLEGYEGWSIFCDEDTGSYEASKAAMVDFEIYLYGPDTEDGDEGELMGTAVGGYYYQGDYSFYGTLEFYPPEPETPESQFRDFLEDIASSDYSLKKMIKKIEKEIERVK